MGTRNEAGSHLWRADQLPADGFDVSLTPQDAGWTYSGLKVLTLAAGESREFSTADSEALAVPLSGSCRVTVDGQTFELAGRTDIFDGPTDFAYLPCGSTVQVTSELGCTVSFPSARTETRLPARYGPVDQVPVELRGAGSASRQVHNFCTPDVFPAAALIACEVLTPAGNTSSYPPHKHDVEGPNESVLEEIYYFRMRPAHAAASSANPVGLQRVYTADESRPLDLAAEVGSGDLVLVPHGWHGPSVALPGYDLYYLNVMAGPGERAWRITDDPAHAWIRGTWADQAIDPRLPFGKRP